MRTRNTIVVPQKKGLSVLKPEEPQVNKAELVTVRIRQALVPTRVEIRSNQVRQNGERTAPRVGRGCTFPVTQHLHF